MSVTQPSSPPRAADSLPTMSARPSADVVIFDGHCRFCQAQVSRLHRFDWFHRLAFISLHDPEVTRRWSDLRHDDLMQEMYVVTHDGRRYAGAAAIRYLSRQLPPLWLLMPLLHIPGTLPLWRFFYRLVAKYRYQLRGKTNHCDGDTCSIHFESRK